MLGNARAVSPVAGTITDWTSGTGPSLMRRDPCLDRLDDDSDLLPMPPTLPGRSCCGGIRATGIATAVQRQIRSAAWLRPSHAHDRQRTRGSAAGRRSRSRSLPGETHPHQSAAKSWDFSGLPHTGAHGRAMAQRRGNRAEALHTRSAGVRAAAAGKPRGATSCPCPSGRSSICGQDAQTVQLRRRSEQQQSDAHHQSVSDGP